ncbi:hypothetical protein ABID26_006592 [Mesorhizobium shonense]|uniref:Hemerythrin-like domain-containing protein n=1 Tax=Mesorhizobium shonense TaxID=1209948 RepID=A0ABV2I3S7_9HYPH
MALVDEIEMARRHVHEGERHLRRQHQLIAGLDEKGLPTDDAMNFLHLLEDMQAMHREHLSRLLRKAGD